MNACSKIDQGHQFYAKDSRATRKSPRESPVHTCQRITTAPPYRHRPCPPG